ncbi:EF-hand_domain pair [Hexamita inflata]|uniref:EF-hand domain pair n=1 Tax=Hexamita inflata TaxID=28002 RepID=A0AA86NF81_9EUKA|nr:EF-hand domain pair [Hexamita inflata]
MLELPEIILRKWYSQLNSNQPVTSQMFSLLRLDFPFVPPALFNKCLSLMISPMDFALFSHYASVLDQSLNCSEQFVLFSILDTTNSNSISIDQFTLFLSALKVETENENCRNVIDFYARNGELEFEDFEIVVNQIENYQT